MGGAHSRSISSSDSVTIASSNGAGQSGNSLVREFTAQRVITAGVGILLGGGGMLFFISV